MSSVHEVIPWAGHVNHAASKGAIIMMMKSMAQELAPKKIRVNSIAPGAIKTAINRSAWDTPATEHHLLHLIPEGRAGCPMMLRAPRFGFHRTRPITSLARRCSSTVE